MTLLALPRFAPSRAKAWVLPHDEVLAIQTHDGLVVGTVTAYEDLLVVRAGPDSLPTMLLPGDVIGITRYGRPPQGICDTSSGGQDGLTNGDPDGNRHPRS